MNTKGSPDRLIYNESRTKAQADSQLLYGQISRNNKELLGKLLKTVGQHASDLRQKEEKMPLQRTERDKATLAEGKDDCAECRLSGTK